MKPLPTTPIPDGNLVSDSRVPTYSYDEFGRMSASSKGGAYSYDADGRLLTQIPAGESPLQFFYAHDLLTGQKQGDTYVSFYRDGAAVHGRTVRTGSTAHSEVNGLNLSSSVIGRASQDGRTTDVMYTPYGESSLNTQANANDLAAFPSIAFNGQRLDALANLYHLGKCA